MTGDTKFFLTLTLLVLLFASIPYGAAMLSSGPDQYYTGIHSLAPGDPNVYFSFINQAQRGAFVFRDVFTTETTAPAIFSPLWLLVGLLGGLFRLSPELAFHFARLATGPLLLLLLWRFIHTFFGDSTRRRFALTAMLFASGVGVLVVVFSPDAFLDPYTRPMDLWVSEGSVLISIMQSVHYVVGTILMVGGFWLLMRALELETWTYSVFSGLLFLGLFSFHPFHVPTVAFVLLIVFFGEKLIRKMTWKKALMLALPMLLASPAVLYHVWGTLFDPLIQGRAEQNINTIPSLPITLASYGFLLPFALVGAYRWIGKGIRYRFVVWWALAHFAVLFAPIFFSRRLSQGLDVPLTLLAVAGFFTLFRWWKKRRPELTLRSLVNPWIFIAIFAFSLSPVFILANDLSLLVSKARYKEFFYRPNVEREAYAAFEAMSEPTDAFLSGFITGNFFAAQTLRHAYIAHGVETLQYNAKKEQVLAFFNAMGPEERAAFLSAHQLSWVILRVEEFSFADIVEETPGISEAFANDAVRIYRFTPAGNTS